MIRKFYVVYKVKKDVVDIFKDTIDQGVTELEEVLAILKPHLPKYYLVAHHMYFDHYFRHSFVGNIHNGTILATQDAIEFAEYSPWFDRVCFKKLKGDDWFLAIPDPSIPDQHCEDPFKG